MGRESLRNSFSLIKEDVDKENTMTPALGPSPKKGLNLSRW